MLNRPLETYNQNNLAHQRFIGESLKEFQEQNFTFKLKIGLSFLGSVLSAKLPAPYAGIGVLAAMAFAIKSFIDFRKSLAELVKVYKWVIALGPQSLSNELTLNLARTIAPLTPTSLFAPWNVEQIQNCDDRFLEILEAPPHNRLVVKVNRQAIQDKFDKLQKDIDPMDYATFGTVLGFVFDEKATKERLKRKMANDFQPKVDQIVAAEGQRIDHQLEEKKQLHNLKYSFWSQASASVYQELIGISSFAADYKP